MEGVVARIEQSYRERPREIYILYANAKYGDVWEHAGCFREVVATSDYTIYQAVGPQ
jgi:hypothetical protein